tara:strand:+ start:509 stop:718 length:210 start_codon:yes stop_codon:yes gene_type:complete
MEKNNTDTHQVQEGGAIGYSSEYLQGLSSIFNEGYKRFCNKKVNILGQKVDRTHLLGGIGRINCSNKES